MRRFALGTKKVIPLGQRDHLRASRNAQLVASLTTFGYIDIALQSCFGRGSEQCLSWTGARLRRTCALRQLISQISLGNASAAIPNTGPIVEMPRRVPRELARSDGDGPSAFAHDPTGSFDEQTIYWAPEALPTVVPLVRSSLPSKVLSTPLDLGLGNIRRSYDGWHAVLHIRGTEHRVWLKEAPQIGASYAAELPFDPDFDMRAHASHRLWRAIKDRAPGPPFHKLSAQRRERLVLALRALDGQMEGASYRAIAEVLFGSRRIPDRDWKSHDLRSRTIRLVHTGVALMRGGYRALLRHRRAE